MDDQAKTKPSVLVVDDEELVASLFEEILTMEGYEVVTASNGNQALQRFEKQKESWNCIIIDLTMPDMVGTEVYKKLCSLRDGVPVIFVSGYELSDSTLDEIDESSPVKFLQKPFSPKELTEVVAKIIGE